LPLGPCSVIVIVLKMYNYVPRRKAIRFLVRAQRSKSKSNVGARVPGGGWYN